MNSSGLRILLVDDNAESSEPLSLLLQTRGHDTRVSVDGEQAIALVGVFRPHCVVLDLGLPRMDGYEVARRLREQHGGDLVLVALTGWSGREVRARAAEAGFDHHLVKPVNWVELDRIIESAARPA